jgi:hypothetical protein
MIINCKRGYYSSVRFDFLYKLQYLQISRSNCTDHYKEKLSRLSAEAQSGRWKYQLNTTHRWVDSERGNKRVDNGAPHDKSQPIGNRSDIHDDISHFTTSCE